MNNWERGLESTETEKNIWEIGLGFSSPSLSVNSFGTMFDVCKRVLPVLDPRC